MSYDDLPLTVPLRAFAEYISCTVCMSTMTDIHLTPCGHRYCGHCIKECISRHHKCPVCNKHLCKEELIRDHQYDLLLKVFEDERKTATEEYFNRVVKSGISKATTDGHNPDFTTHFSPVEQVLRNHLKQSLAVHGKYFHDLKDEFSKKQRYLEVELKNEIELLPKIVHIQHELDDAKQILEQTYTEKINKLEADMVNCSKMVAEAYDRYLSEHIPSLSVLPVKVSICILCKHTTIPDVQLKPQDSVADIENIVKDHFASIDDTISKMDVKYVCFGPFNCLNTEGMTEAICRVVDKNEPNPDLNVLTRTSRPVLQCALKPGSTIAVYGRVECESDQPKQCFVTTYNPGDTTTVDYFTCKTCNINWICRSCMFVCHKDHEMTPYILNHQPNWACCYCVKKKKCKLHPPPGGAGERGMDIG